MSEPSVVYYYANLAGTYCEVIFGFCREFYGLILHLGIFLEEGLSEINYAKFCSLLGPGTKGQIAKEKDR